MDRFLKIGFGALAALALVFGFVNIGQSLKLTFKEDTAGGASAADDNSLNEAKLRLRDTDTDGFNDWDELYTYGTSPYLADTDSDKSSDYEEIKNNTDPLCPQGTDCGSQSLAAPAPNTFPNSLLPTADGSVASTSNLMLTAEDVQALSGDDIRSILKQAGITDEQLQGATDDDLRQLVQEIINANAEY